MAFLFGERLITRCETNGSRYDYGDGREREQGREREREQNRRRSPLTEWTTSDVTNVIFFFPSSSCSSSSSTPVVPTDRGPTVAAGKKGEEERSVAYRGGGDTGWDEGEGRNNLKAELNFSSSESFVGALGGGQWLNGDVSRKVDSRERAALYRPFLVPPSLYPAGTHSPKHGRFHCLLASSVPRCRSTLVAPTSSLL